MEIQVEFGGGGRTVEGFFPQRCGEAVKTGFKPLWDVVRCLGKMEGELTIDEEK